MGEAERESGQCRHGAPNQDGDRNDRSAFAAVGKRHLQSLTLDLLIELPAAGGQQVHAAGDVRSHPVAWQHQVFAATDERRSSAVVAYLQLLVVAQSSGVITDPAELDVALTHVRAAEVIKEANLNLGYDQERIFILKYCLLEKAVYEIGYVLNSRPKWTLIPLKGISNIINH